MTLIPGLPTRDAEKDELVSLDVEMLRQPMPLHIPRGDFGCLSIGMGKDVFQIYNTRDLPETLKRIWWGTWTMHNAIYDIRQLRRWVNITERPIWDTLLVEKHLFAGYYTITFGLEDLARRWLRERMNKSIRDKFSDHTEMTLEMKRYAAKDASCTLEIAKRQAELTKTVSFRSYWEVNEPVLWALLDMPPVRLDTDRWIRISSEMKVKGEILVDQLGFNPNSPKQVMKVMNERYDKKFKNTRRVTMEQLGGDPWNSDDGGDPFVKKILQARTYLKLASTYGENWGEFLDENNYIQAGWNADGATTGRMSCSEPNLQNVPVRDFPQYRECFVASPGNKYVLYDACLDGDVRVLHTDLHWTPIRDVVVGDSLIGFEEMPNPQGSGHGRTLRESVVEGVSRVTKPCYHVFFEDGTSVICSNHHAWLVKQFPSGGAYVWRETESLKIGDELQAYLDPWETDTSRDAGYLAGFLDGEGSAGEGGHHSNGARKGSKVNFSQKRGQVSEKVLELLKLRGIRVGPPHDARGGFSGSLTPLWDICGEDAVRLLGTIRPLRLLAKSRPFWDGRLPHQPPKVVSNILFVGDHEVIAVQTSTRTFVAEGLLSHNSQQEPRVGAHLTRDPKLLEVFQEGESIYLQVAEMMGRNVEKGTKAYDNIKKVILGSFYGLTGPGLAKQQRIPKEDAIDLQSQFFNIFGGIKPWMDQQRRIAWQKGYVETVLGRRLWVNPYDKHSANNAVNNPVQGSAGEMTKLALYNIWKMSRERGLPFLVNLVIHDETNADVPKAMVKEYGKLIDEAWHEASLHVIPDIPFKGELAVGKSWGAK